MNKSLEVRVKFSVGWVSRCRGGGVVLGEVLPSLCLDLLLCSCWVVCVTCASALCDSDWGDAESDLLFDVVLGWMHCCHHGLKHCHLIWHKQVLFDHWPLSC